MRTRHLVAVIALAGLSACSSPDAGQTANPAPVPTRSSSTPTATTVPAATTTAPPENAPSTAPESSTGPTTSEAAPATSKGEGKASQKGDEKGSQKSGEAAQPEPASDGVQGSPDAVATAFLQANGAGDANRACELMAANGRPLTGNPTAMDKCVNTIDGMHSQLASMLSQFKKATVTGATATGDTASVKDADFKPALGKTLFDSFTIVKIDGKWYITQA
ncbi:MAG: hypothetical protein ACK5LN_01175 [Propioniciclava sp.]